MMLDAFKSDKLMDALFQEGQSAPQTPQTLFDADFEGLASYAEVYVFNQVASSLKLLSLLLLVLFAVITLHNISLCIYQDVA